MENMDFNTQKKAAKEIGEHIVDLAESFITKEGLISFLQYKMEEIADLISRKVQ